MLDEATAPAVSFMQVTPRLCPTPSMNIKKRKLKKKQRKLASPVGLEPETIRLTAERANQLRHGDKSRSFDDFNNPQSIN